MLKLTTWNQVTFPLSSPSHFKYFFHSMSTNIYFLDSSQLSFSLFSLSCIYHWHVATITFSFEAFFFCHNKSCSCRLTLKIFNLLVSASVLIVRWNAYLSSSTSRLPEKRIFSVVHSTESSTRKFSVVSYIIREIACILCWIILYHSPTLFSYLFIPLSHFFSQIILGQDLCFLSFWKSTEYRGVLATA